VSFDGKIADTVETPLVSVIINNFNYARFLPRAVDSALNQSYQPIEVVVVDDGSTDGSLDVIASYGIRIKSILKVNGGQASALNAGVAASRGEVLCFLDSDDFFYPDKVARVVEAFRQIGASTTPAMLHHVLAVESDERLDICGRPYGHVSAARMQPVNHYLFAQRHRFLPYEGGPTSCLSVNRRLADLLFPLPEKGVRVCADDFIVYAAPLVARVYAIGEILGGYRVHGSNQWHHGSGRKSPEFMSILQSYLNAKLVEQGLSPVIVFEDSVHAWWDLAADRRWLKLGLHMLRLLIRNRDRYTAHGAWQIVTMIAGHWVSVRWERARKLWVG